MQYANGDLALPASQLFSHAIQLGVDLAFKRSWSDHLARSDAPCHRICIRTPEELRMEHGLHNIVRAKFCPAGGEGVGKLAGKVGFSRDAKNFSQSVASSQICHCYPPPYISLPKFLH